MELAFTLRYAWTDDGIRFSVKDGEGKEVASSDYTAEFVETGESDQVSAGVTGGSIRIVNRGVTQCAASLGSEGPGMRSTNYVFSGL